MLFIDTHIVIWLYQNTLDYLSIPDIKALEKNEINISPVVSLEIEYLFEIGRIKKGSAAIIEFLSDKIGLNTDNCDFQKVMQFSLKEKWTRDPFDRIIVSHARLRNAGLLTKDKKIRKNYSNVI